MELRSVSSDAGVARRHVGTRALEVATPSTTIDAVAANDAELRTAEAIVAEITASGILDSRHFYEADDASEVIHRHLADDGFDAFADPTVARRVTETVDLLLDPDIVTQNDRGDPLRCGDCERRIAYDYGREVYRHLVDPQHGCFLINAETHEDIDTAATSTAVPARPVQPSRPLLRRTGEQVPTPPGWLSVLAGRNRSGQDLEVIYDPRRYEVLIVHGGRGGMFPRLADEASSRLMLDALAITGWEPHHVGEPQIWIRDRTEAERLAIEHHKAGQQPEVRFHDLAPTQPFLRPDCSTLPIPPGWIAEPAGISGTSNDDVAEIVYNPQRHDVMRVPHARTDAILAVLADQGWTRASRDSTSQLLWRDRIAHTRSAVERLTARPATEIEGPGRGGRT